MARLWVEYHNRKLDGKLAPACGSDAFQPLDGRFSIARCIDEARDRARAMRRVHHYEAFRIMSGERPSSANPVTGIIAL